VTGEINNNIHEITTVDRLSVWADFRECYSLTRGIVCEGRTRFQRWCSLVGRRARFDNGGSPDLDAVTMITSELLGERFYSCIIILNLKSMDPKVYGRSLLTVHVLLALSATQWGTAGDASAENESPGEPPIKIEHSESSYRINTSMNTNSLTVVTKPSPHESNPDVRVSTAARVVPAAGP